MSKLLLFITLCLAVVLVTSALSGAALAHPEDDFCEIGGGIDPALCRQLAEANSSDAQVVTPLLDEDGEVRSAWDTAVLYIKIGIQHILPGGTDHILFVLSLFLASERLRNLIIQISTFTVAHTATLGLTAAGIIDPPGGIVEPLIALSIAFVAVENLFFRNMPAWRPLVVFGFGLFHGMGFAGFIREVGLPPDQFWSSLIGFNIGVEVGQLAVVVAALVLRGPIKKALGMVNLSYHNAIVAPASILIAATGMWWAVTRVLGY
ncbi:MAG: HupE/UreJ family protein [Pseudomonadota bacterium]